MSRGLGDVYKRQVLVEGQIIASGQPDEIRVNRKVLAAYLGDEG